jgi:hypothetical protein
MSRNLRHLLLFSLIGASAWAIGCSLDECETTADCEEGATCVIEVGEETGTCEGPETNGTDTGGTVDAGRDSGTDIGRDSGTDPTPVCGGDGACNPDCGGTDPDCTSTCDCDNTVSFCDNSGSSTAVCACDDDCIGRTACSDDGFCDDSCPEGSDLNCDCSCDYNDNVCESRARGTTETCACDFDCQNGETACGDDNHCDTFCPDGTDPDCDTEPECSCDYNEGICEVASRGSSMECMCDTDCVGADPCKNDGHCDTWCPAGFDPDCR